MVSTVNMNCTDSTRYKVTEHTDFPYCTLKYEKPDGFKCYFTLHYHSGEYQYHTQCTACDHEQFGTGVPKLRGYFSLHFQDTLKMVAVLSP
jgi:hypothetical protein